MKVILLRKDRIEYVLTKCVLFYKAPRIALLGYVRKRKPSIRKKLIMKILREVADLSFKEVGYLCSCNVSRAYKAINEVNYEIEIDADVRRNYEALVKEILEN